MLEVRKYNIKEILVILDTWVDVMNISQMELFMSSILNITVEASPDSHMGKDVLYFFYRKTMYYCHFDTITDKLVGYGKYSK